MPRGVKGSGKKPVNSKKPATEKKERKAYPTYQERIEAADKKMEQLQKLIASREALISQNGSQAGGAGRGPGQEPGGSGKSYCETGAPGGPHE